jgi:glycosyltransferase involved in cell wall biosynthesis
MIPCHNEADTIARVVTETRRHVPVVIVVDDGSTDDTAAEARRSGAEVIRHLPCRGNGVALEAGFRRSLFIFIARPGRLV